MLGSPVVKNQPCNAGDVGSIPSQETKIPRAVEQLNPHATTREARMPQLRPNIAKYINIKKKKKVLQEPLLSQSKKAKSYNDVKCSLPSGSQGPAQVSPL